ncbi:MAG: hypothetical protein AB7F31_03410 [Parachlamydiales bacterium]
MRWELFDSGKRGPSENMALDANLLLSLREKPRPILHLYDWEGDAATYGHFIKPEEHLNLEGAARRGLQLARRPTGGGITFHVTDLAFSVLIPAGHEGFSDNTLENYHWVNSHLQRVLSPYLEGSSLLSTSSVGSGSPFSFCMAKPTVYDVMVSGQKVGGAAQRRKSWGYLHQGTISIASLPETYLEEVLLPDMGVLEAMKGLTFPLLPEGWSRGDLEEMRQELKKRLAEVFVC